MQNVLNTVFRFLGFRGRVTYFRFSRGALETEYFRASVGLGVKGE